MSILDDVRKALQPLIDQGTVDKVESVTSASYGERNPLQPVQIDVFVNGDNPEEHRVEIERLAKQTGHNVEIVLHPNYSRA